MNSRYFVPIYIHVFFNADWPGLSGSNSVDKGESEIVEWEICLSNDWNDY